MTINEVTTELKQASRLTIALLRHPNDHGLQAEIFYHLASSITRLPAPLGHFGDTLLRSGHDWDRSHGHRFFAAWQNYNRHAA